MSNASGFSAVYSYLPGVGMVTGIVFSADGVVKMNTVKTYDDLYRLTLIQSSTATGVVNSFSYQYNNANQRSQAVMADGTYWNYVYDYLGQVSNAVRRWASDNTVVFGQDYEYVFDDIGNRVNVSRNAVESEYSVNLLNQYTSRTVPSTVEINGAAAETAYVTVNNIPAERRGEFFNQEFAVTNTTSAVWSPVEVVAVLKNAGSNGADIVSSQSGHVFVAQTPEQFSHDQDGNLTQDGRWEYSWDGENRLTAVESRTNVTGMTRTRCEYTYDAQSRRIAKTSLSGWTGTSYSTTNVSLFVYDGWLLLSELQVSGLNLQVLTNSYVWGLDLSGSLQGAGGIGGLLFAQLNNPATSNSTTVFYAYDGNGNVTDLVDANGSIAAHYEYSPFGETLVATGPMVQVNPFRFSTKYYDQETGLYYYGYRFYSPTLGRWLSRDPIAERGDDNLYAYVINAPLDVIDILGLKGFVVIRGYEKNKDKTYTSAEEVMKDADRSKSVLGGGTTHTVGPIPEWEWKVVEPAKKVVGPPAWYTAPEVKKKCYTHIVFRIEVLLDKDLTDISEGVVFVSYRPHVKGTDGLAIIRSYSEQFALTGQKGLKNVIESHEKGHVQALFDFVAEAESTVGVMQGQEFGTPETAQKFMAFYLLYNDSKTDMYSGKKANDYTYAALSAGKWIEKTDTVKAKQDYDPLKYGKLYSK